MLDTMPAWTLWLLAIAGVLLALLAALAGYGALRWSAATRRLIKQLDATRVAPQVRRYNAQEIAGLPAPVQRYFRAVLKDGQPIIGAATVEHSGSFNLSATGERWMPFRSHQRVVTRRPGFVWDARIRLLPGLAVHVHDAYVAGVGILNPSVLGLYSLAGEYPASLLSQGEFIRFFAETAWYPTALLPSQGVRWQAVDANSAQATLSDGPLTQTLLMTFNESGLIERVKAEARGAVVGHSVVMTPWEGRWSDYQLRDGMLVPLTGEVAWLYPQGRQPYWRGSITALRYEFARP